MSSLAEREREGATKPSFSSSPTGTPPGTHSLRFSSPFLRVACLACPLVVSSPSSLCCVYYHVFFAFGSVFLTRIARVFSPPLVCVCARARLMFAPVPVMLFLSLCGAPLLLWTHPEAIVVFVLLSTQAAGRHATMVLGGSKQRKGGGELLKGPVFFFLLLLLRRFLCVCACLHSLLRHGPPRWHSRFVRVLDDESDDEENKTTSFLLLRRCVRF